MHRAPRWNKVSISIKFPKSHGVLGASAVRSSYQWGFFNTLLEEGLLCNMLEVDYVEV